MGSIVLLPLLERNFNVVILDNGVQITVIPVWLRCDDRRAV